MRHAPAKIACAGATMRALRLYPRPQTKRGGRFFGARVRTAAGMNRRSPYPASLDAAEAISAITHAMPPNQERLRSAWLPAR